MCTSNVSNVIYHKFSHGAAFYTLNGKNVNVMLEFVINHVTNARCTVHIFRHDDVVCKHFSNLRDRVCSIFSGAGKFCLAHGLGQLARSVKSDVRTLNFITDVTFAPP